MQEHSLVPHETDKEGVLWREGVTRMPSTRCGTVRPHSRKVGGQLTCDNTI